MLVFFLKKTYGPGLFFLEENNGPALFPKCLPSCGTEPRKEGSVLWVLGMRAVTASFRKA